MKRNPTPLQGLWILFFLQVALLAGLLVLFVVFEPHITRSVSQMQEADAKMPFLKQRIDQADFEHLHKDALVLLETSEIQSVSVRSLETNTIRMMGDACFFLGVITCWLGIVAFQLHQKSKNNSP
jgi:hypothetical protein